MAKKKEIVPSTNGANGRLPNGRFAKGNPGGPGNPHVVAVGAWRNALVGAVTEDDIRQITATLIEKAKAGEPWAVRELLDRCLGKPQQRMELEATGEKTWAMMLACLENATESTGGEQ